jgi:fused signal recognition particle receptor
MFGFLKKKLKETVEKFSSKASKEEIADEDLTQEDQERLHQEEENLIKQADEDTTHVNIAVEDNQKPSQSTTTSKFSAEEPESEVKESTPALQDSVSEEASEAKVPKDTLDESTDLELEEQLKQPVENQPVEQQSVENQSADESISKDEPSVTEEPVPEEPSELASEEKTDFSADSASESKKSVEDVLPDEFTQGEEQHFEEKQTQQEADISSDIENIPTLSEELAQEQEELIEDVDTEKKSIDQIDKALEQDVTEQERPLEELTPELNDTKDKATKNKATQNQDGVSQDAAQESESLDATQPADALPSTTKEPRPVEQTTSTPAPADSEDIEIKTGKKSFFGRLFGKKEKKEETFSAAVDLDHDLEEFEHDAQHEKELEEGVIDTPADIQDQQIDSDEDTSNKAAPKIDTAVSMDATKKQKGFFSKLKEKVVKFKLDEETFEELFWDFELAMLENNVAVEVIEKIKADLHDVLTKENVSRRGVEDAIMQSLRSSLSDILDIEPVDLLENIKTKKPYIISVIGVNGSGKTTSIAKLVHHLQKNNLSVVLAASDTFRAAAIQQLEEHANKLDVKLIKHDYGADPSAVAFDAIKHAQAKGIDVVLIDTAGRLQSNSNLMDELKKLIRVNNPDFKLFVGESITGNDCTEQAVAFNEAVGIDGIILSKADVDDKGGAAISVSYVTGKPILYLGTGQTYDDLEVFNKKKVLDSLFS